MYTQNKESRFTVDRTELAISDYLQRLKSENRSPAFYYKDNIRSRLLYDELVLDWYIELPDHIQNLHDGIINILRTKCNYGGERFWLQCPDCLEKRETLYLEKGNFSCRNCLRATYVTKSVNYRSLGYTFMQLHKEQRLVAKLLSSTNYSGKNYKRDTNRLYKLRGKIEQLMKKTIK